MLGPKNENPRKPFIPCLIRLIVRARLFLRNNAPARRINRSRNLAWAMTTHRFRMIIEATSNVSYKYFSDSIYDLARASGWPGKQMELLVHAAWSMEHGLATLILSGRAPRIDSDVDPEKMIELAINMYLAAVVAGPEAFKAIAPHKSRELSTA